MTVQLHTGDCLKVLRTLPSNSVHCCLSSPPYFGLRDYHAEGQIGIEVSHLDYVAKLVQVFEEVRRVLRPDGTFWLNLGDSYAGSGRGGYAGGKSRIEGTTDTQDQSRLARRGSQLAAGKQESARASDAIGRAWVPPPPGLKAKSLIGIPWRVAFALQDDGWLLRKENIWAKSNGMPESVKDRPTSAHEQVFLFSKTDDYFYAYDDVRLPPAPESVSRLERAMRSKLEANGMVLSGGSYNPPGQPPQQAARRSNKQRGHDRRHDGFNERWDKMERDEQQASGAALRSVWWIATSGFDGPHFAVMPAKLAAICILAGCPEGGTVLDPFGGAGTTALVADRLGRDALMIELNPEYVAMAQRRIAADAGMFAEIVA